MKPQLTTPIQIDGYDAYWLGTEKELCPYDAQTETGKWYEWEHGFCLAHAEAEDVMKEVRRGG